MPRRVHLTVYQEFNFEGADAAWSWSILVPASFLVRPPPWRSYKTAAGARRAAEVVCRRLNLKAPARRRARKEVRS
jgi:hypothetical protein